MTEKGAEEGRRGGEGDRMGGEIRREGRGLVDRDRREGEGRGRKRKGAKGVRGRLSCAMMSSASDLEWGRRRKGRRWMDADVDGYRRGG